MHRSSCLNYLHRLGFVFKRPKKRLLKADEAKREAFAAEYAALWDEAGRTGGKIFFADEAHFRADAELRGMWVLKGEPALVDSSSPRYGEKASYYSAVCLETGEGEWMELEGKQQRRNRGWAREEATGNLCLGSKAKVQERVGSFLASLSSRKEEVKRRCRTVLQSKAEALLRNRNPRPESQHPTNAHPTLV